MRLIFSALRALPKDAIIATEFWYYGKLERSAMSSREDMLDRVRKALHRPNTGYPLDPVPTLDLAGVMPFVAPEDYLAKFEGEWEKVAGIAHRVASIAELDATLMKALAPAESNAVVLSGNPWLAELGLAQRLTSLNKLVTSWTANSGVPGTTSLSDFTKASFAAGAGITGVDFVLAESGTLVLSSATERVQLSSLAPPVHIALYRRHQLIGSLDEVLAKLSILNQGHPSAGRSVVFITGTSRTADIEQILIRGVHGPREVHAILVEDSCR